MAAETHTQSFWEHLDVIVKTCSDSLLSELVLTHSLNLMQIFLIQTATVRNTP